MCSFLNFHLSCICLSSIPCPSSVRLQMLLMKLWAALNYRSMLNWLAQRGKLLHQLRNEATHLSVIGLDRHFIMWRTTCLLLLWFSSHTTPCRDGLRHASFAAPPEYEKEESFFPFLPSFCININKHTPTYFACFCLYTCTHFLFLF